MIGIELDNVSKRYGFQPIISNIDLSIDPSERIGISGRNGSGKSTLLKIISSYLSPSGGKITYSTNGRTLKIKDVAQKIGFSAPYIKVTQEMSLSELFSFQSKFKSYYTDLSYKEFLDIIQLPNPKSKEIRMFSSGMQQKVNLGLSIMSKCEILLLDEPTSYLDDEAKVWFHALLDKFIRQRTIIIASNDQSDFQLISKKYQIIDKQLKSI